MADALMLCAMLDAFFAMPAHARYFSPWMFSCRYGERIYYAMFRRAMPLIALLAADVDFDVSLFQPLIIYSLSHYTIHASRLLRSYSLYFRHAAHDDASLPPPHTLPPAIAIISPPSKAAAGRHASFFFRFFRYLRHAAASYAAATLDKRC